MSESPKPKKPRPRPVPKITLPVPGQYAHYPQTPVGYVATPYGQTPIPPTPGPGQPQDIYYNKASEFVFAQIKGIKDFTKSGLSVGEKSAFWLYEKVSSWSKRWFTHIFLVVVVFLYSVAGAFLFIYIEGGQETKLERTIHQDRNKTVWEIRDLCEQKDIFDQRDIWHGHVANRIEDYESKLRNHFKYGFMNTKEELWTFWNAVFYCGTIYTTIDDSKSPENVANENRTESVRRARDTSRRRAKRSQERLSSGGSSADDDKSSKSEAERHERKREKRPRRLRKESSRRNDINDVTRSSRHSEPTVPPRLGKPHLETSSSAASPPRKPAPEDASKARGSKSASEEATSSRSRRSPFSEAGHGDIDQKPEAQPTSEGSNKPRGGKSTPEEPNRSRSRRSPHSETDQHSPRAGGTARQRSPSEERHGDLGQKPKEPPRPTEDSTRPRGGKAPEEPPRSRSRRSSCSDDRLGDANPPQTTKETHQLSRQDKESNSSEHRTDGIPSRFVKQIIPLDNDSLMHDLEIAQQQYDRREIGILDPDVEDYVSPKMEAALKRRKRHKSKIEAKDVAPDKGDIENVKGSWLWSCLKFFKSRKEKVDEPTVDVPEPAPVEKNVEDKREDGKRSSRLLEFVRTSSDLRTEFRFYVSQNPRQTDILRRHRNRCIAELILMIIYCGLGAFVFRFTEGAFEQFYKCGVKRVKRDFLDSLWNYSHNLREDDWKSLARRKLKEFEEQLYEAYDAGLHTYSGQKTWSFLNAFVYCLTVVTTIGYGHIYPTTSTGQAMTIIYAIFGIPMFLIILADFGKLFTRGMKFLWAFVRRVYYTGSCRRVRRTAPVQEVMKGVQLVYDFATFRRPSQMNPEEIEEMNRQAAPQTVLSVDGNAPLPQPDTPGTPAFSAFEIDDEFNLPISVAITLLLAYIFVGATAYNIWEDWNFFQSFYFVFISMSTIGFGDFVPKHPIYMMCSIVYLVFGLALTSMCINVVQVMLSDSFKQASQKIGATIGFEVAVDDGSIQTTAPPPVEVADVHATIKEDDEYNEKKQAPKAKEEDVDL